ncbi:hypothetical protein SRDD_27200 [Serratia sp. DD3]|nr:hypothetical protein SRDD_27200 [Serratia sp. DD3]
MNSLAATNRLPQLRCLALPGGAHPVRFHYQRRIASHWVPCNYGRAAAILEVIKRRRRTDGKAN